MAIVSMIVTDLLQRKVKNPYIPVTLKNEYLTQDKLEERFNESK